MSSYWVKPNSRILAYEAFVDRAHVRILHAEPWQLIIQQKDVKLQMDWSRHTDSKLLRLDFTCLEGSMDKCQSTINSLIRHIHVLSPSPLRKTRRLDTNASKEHNDLVPMADGWANLYPPSM